MHMPYITNMVAHAMPGASTSVYIGICVNYNTFTGPSVK